MLTDRTTDFIAMYTLNKIPLHFENCVTYSSVLDDHSLFCNLLQDNTSCYICVTVILQRYMKRVLEHSFQKLKFDQPFQQPRCQNPDIQAVHDCNLGNVLVA
jgi:hypothetical protein